MSTQDISPTNKYLGNGVADEFYISFPYTDKSHVKVYVQKTDEDQVELTDSEYSFISDDIIKYPLSGDVLADGEVITINRETPLESGYEFDNTSRLYPESVMLADDLGFRMIQELAAELDRAVKVDETSTQTPEELAAELVASGEAAVVHSEAAAASAEAAAASELVATTAVDGFDDAVESATDTFNDNYDTKKALIDAQTSIASNAATSAAASASAAASSETASIMSEELAEQYADEAEASKIAAAASAEGIATAEATAVAAATTATAQAVIATTKAGEASDSADESEYWAIADITVNTDGSSKYWAEQSAFGQVQVDLSQTDSDAVDYVKGQSVFTIPIAEIQTDLLQKGLDIAANTAAISAIDTTLVGISSSITTLDADVASLHEYTDDITTEAAASKIPRANTSGKLNAGWIPIASDDTFATGTSTTEVPNVAQVVTALNSTTSLIPATIIQSTVPQTDAGLHLADGTLLSGTGSYSDFYDYFVDNADSFTDQLTTETEWQASVTAYGVCGKYVLDTTAQTLRLPLITGFIEGATSDVGELNEAGLPNITGTLGNRGNSNYIDTTSLSGAFTTGTGGAFSTTTSAVTTATSPLFDASLSNNIYGSSTTVQPQSIKVYYYIVVGTVTKTDITVDIDEIASDLAGKADTDLTNVTVLVETIAEEYSNGTDWYIIYKRPQSDGTVKYWCEQGGLYVNTLSTASNSVSIELNVPFSDDSYQLNVIKNGNATYTNSPFSFYTLGYRTKTLSSFTTALDTVTYMGSVSWTAQGYCDAPTTGDIL